MGYLFTKTSQQRNFNSHLKKKKKWGNEHGSLASQQEYLMNGI